MCIRDSKKSVDEFMEKHGSINLLDKLIPVRRLVNPAQKLVISNASPHIPDVLIESALVKTTGIKLCSPIIHLKGSFDTSALKHILTFRRAVWYQTNEDDIKFPDNLVLTLPDSEQHRIFLTTDTTPTCFLNKKAT